MGESDTEDRREFKTANGMEKMALEKKSMHSSIILHSRVEWKYIAKVERCYFIAKTIQYERMRFSISKEKWSLLQP